MNPLLWAWDSAPLWADLARAGLICLSAVLGGLIVAAVAR